VSLRPQPNLKTGAILMITAAALFVAMGACVHAASQDLPTPMVVFFRSFVSLVVLLPLVGSLGGFRTFHLRDHLVRGLAGVASLSCFYVALARLPLAEATLLNQSMPVFIPLVEWACTRERFETRLIGPLGIGFVGLLLVLKPGSSVFQPVALVGAASALLGAVAQVGVRRLARTESVTRIVFYYGLIASAASLPPTAITWVNPSWRGWWLLLAVGGFATVGQLLLTRSYTYAPAAHVGPFLYTGVVFAAALDLALWGRRPDLLTFGGAALVCGAAILTLRLRLGPEAASATDP
jgi:drug/metabolite transporter (DMT)-like permease